MRRREFLKAVAGMAGAAMTFCRAWADEIPSDLKITRVVGFTLESTRYKLCGRNSRLGVHGWHGKDRMVRLYTNMGIEGLGKCRAKKEHIAQLLGKNPFEFYRRQERVMIGPLGTGTMPLWDLAGKILGKPGYELLGGAGTNLVPVYDGSYYFADLLPQYADRPLDRFKQELDMSLARGHRAFKVKIGRGAKWMASEAGYKRDVEVLKTIRRHLGPKAFIGADSNNGYGLERSKRLLNDLPEFNLAFLEEMFPETVEQCLEFKQFIAEHRWKTLVADGESADTPDWFKPFVEARALDVLQGDMSLLGFEGMLAESEMAKSTGIKVAPHNWGSLIGFYMGLHVGRAIPNFYIQECDPLSTPVLIADGYKLEDGYAAVPDSPGFGLKINEAEFAATVDVEFDLEA